MEETESVGTESSTLSDEQVEALADKVDQGRNSERPMTQELQNKPETPAEMYEFNHNGKAVKATRDQVLKWAQQGYDYPQKVQKLNQERANWEHERNQHSTKYKVYQDIDSWAQKNPDQWQRLEQLWKSGQITQGQAIESAQAQSQGQPANDPYASRFQTLEQTLGVLLEDRNTMLAKKADEDLSNTIQSIRDKNKDLDWDVIDDNGQTLEVRLIEHARTLGIPDAAKAYQLAFKDLLHDQLIERKEAQAKINVSRNVQANRKAGVLGETPTSTKIPLFSQPKDIRNTSYNDLEREALAELKSGRYS